MGFTQTMTIQTSDADGLRRMLEAWHREQHGVAPGYERARVLADRDAADRFVIEVDFSSLEEAQRNNERSETQTWAEQLRDLAEGEPEYGNYEVAFSVS